MFLVAPNVQDFPPPPKCLEISTENLLTSNPALLPPSTVQLVKRPRFNSKIGYVYCVQISSCASRKWKGGKRTSLNHLHRHTSCSASGVSSSRLCRVGKIPMSSKSRCIVEAASKRCMASRKGDQIHEPELFELFPARVEANSAGGP